MVYYKFPFQGRWRVLKAHYGAPQADQVYALDLVPDAAITTRKQNTGFPCYNQPVVADAPGVIVIAVDGNPDNQPGVRNAYDAHGNFVVIDHENGEFSLMAHLMPGSLKVRPGTRVVTGAELGRCGNSGHSGAPHIHWQVMDNANAHQGRGIPPRFAPYSRNGKPAVEAPEKDDTLENR